MVILSHINHIFPVSLRAAVSADVSAAVSAAVSALAAQVSAQVRLNKGRLPADTSQGKFISVDQEAEGITCV